MGQQTVEISFFILSVLPMACGVFEELKWQASLNLRSEAAHLRMGDRDSVDSVIVFYSQLPEIRTSVDWENIQYYK